MTTTEKIQTHMLSLEQALTDERQKDAWLSLMALRELSDSGEPIEAAAFASVGTDTRMLLLDSFLANIAMILSTGGHPNPFKLPKPHA